MVCIFLSVCYIKHFIRIFYLELYIMHFLLTHTNTRTHTRTHARRHTHTHIYIYFLFLFLSFSLFHSHTRWRRNFLLIEMKEHGEDQQVIYYNVNQRNNHSYQSHTQPQVNALHTIPSLYFHPHHYFFLVSSSLDCLFARF